MKRYMKTWMVMFSAAAVIAVVCLAGCTESPKEKAAGPKKEGAVPVQKQGAVAPSEKFQAALKKAQEGDAASQRDVGAMYVEGKEVQKDVNTGVGWLEKSATQGDTWAAFALGRLYREGKDAPQDFWQALDWYKKSASGGNQAAELQVADMLIKGEGVKQDVNAGLKIVQQLADEDYVWAQYHLGHLYGVGEFVPKDERLARMWFGKAADQGNEPAKARLKDLRK